ncbi:MAG TPA: hypothetical protein VGO47_11100 [Chlamydiales bacterium]|nr:hypothetical protein [Chlamydiales bacterium]
MNSSITYKNFKILENEHTSSLVNYQEKDAVKSLDRQGMRTFKQQKKKPTKRKIIPRLSGREQTLIIQRIRHF